MARLDKELLEGVLVLVLMFAVVYVSTHVHELKRLILPPPSTTVSQQISTGALSRAVVRVQGFQTTQTGQQGTGFNVGPSGVIVTNAHIIENAILYKVVFPGGGEWPAKVRFCDRDKDIAILTLSHPKELPCVELGDSDQISAGARVILIGNPLNKTNAVSYGEVERVDVYTDLSIPTLVLNATTKLGSSGSPVFDQAGRVIGMTFAQGTNVDGTPIPGLVYAVPINEVKPYLP